MTPAQEHRALAKERRRAERERYKKSQADKRAAEKGTRGAKKSQLAKARDWCKENAKHARDVARDVYKREQQAIRERRKATVRAASEGCRGSKAHIRASADASIAASKRLREEERRVRAELARTEAHARKRNRSRATSSERRSEADEAVAVNIAPGERALWNRVKGSIRGTDRKSRTQAFEQYVEENPGEAVRARETAAESAWKREVRERYREEAAERRRSARSA